MTRLVGCPLKRAIHPIPNHISLFVNVVSLSYAHQHLNGKQNWTCTRDTAILREDHRDAWVKDNFNGIEYKRSESISYSFYRRVDLLLNI